MWGAVAGAFGEGMMHPVDTLKTRLQSQAIMTGAKVWDLFLKSSLGFLVVMHDFDTWVPCLSSFVLNRLRRIFFRWSRQFGRLMA